MNLLNLCLIVAVLGANPAVKPAAPPPPPAPGIPATKDPVNSGPVSPDPASPDQGTRGLSTIIYACNFSEQFDSNYDGWPDHWTRRRGAGFPPYLKVAIVPADSERPRGSRHLQMNLDGGAIQVNSPPLPISDDYEYLLEVQVRTQGLQHDAAFVTLTFQDENRKPIDTFASPSIRTDGGWRTVKVGPFSPDDEAARFAVIGLQLLPGAEQDLRGSAMFSEIKLAKLPKLSLRPQRSHGVYTLGETAEIRCTATGIENVAGIELQLLDMDEQVIDRTTQQGASQTWSPKFPGSGYYRVRAELRLPDGYLLHREVPIAIVADAKTRIRGEFGWSLDRTHPLQRRDRPEMRDLVELFERSLVHWVKYPIWKDIDDSQSLAKLSWLAERLHLDRLHLVAVLDEPPSTLVAKARERGPLSVGEVFADNQAWPDAIDSVLSLLAMHVRWWQLGTDNDASMTAIPKLVERLAEVRSRVHQFGSNIRIGIPWPWVREIAEDDNPPWDFLVRGETPSLTSDELQNYLVAAHAGKESESQRERPWLSIEPLSRSEYALADRVQDLVKRILVARQRGIRAIFVTNPFDSETGLMTPEGHPSDLYLPWHTTASHLLGTEYLGTMQLPRGSRNHVFARGDELFMVVWSDQPVEERLFLGKDARCVDVWGRSRPLAIDQTGGRPVQQITANSLPQFLVGLDPLATRVRLGFHIDTPRLDTTLGQEQRLACRFTNTQAASVQGSVSFVAPSSWRVSDRSRNLQIASGQDEVCEFLLQFGSDVTNDRQPIQLDLDLNGERELKFSVYGAVELGSGDFTVELSARLDDQGNLIVDQVFQNHGDHAIDFNCVLYIPERGRQSKPIRNLRRGQVMNTYIIPDGAELVGKVLWLRAEEVDGDRVLNQTLLVSP
ncbi:MAG: hypothetical protein RIS70_166 [Planctomycetota bacterium]